MAKQGDFYILGSDNPRDVYLFASRLTEKALGKGLRVHICADDDNELAQLDEILWTFRDGSFIPHDRINEADPQTPVTLGTTADLDAHADVLINLAANIPQNLRNFERIAEIVSAAPKTRRQSREHYRVLKDQGLNLLTHNMDG